MPPPAARPPLVELVPEAGAARHDELLADHAAFAPLLHREEQRHWALQYLAGQRLPRGRTSIAPLAAAVVGGKGQARQQFSGGGAGDDAAVLAKQQG